MDALHRRLERSRQMQTVLKAFEARDRNLLEDNLWRVSFWSCTSVLVMLCVALTQVRGDDSVNPPRIFAFRLFEACEPPARTRKVLWSAPFPTCRSTPCASSLTTSGGCARSGGCAPISWRPWEPNANWTAAYFFLSLLHLPLVLWTHPDVSLLPLCAITESLVGPQTRKLNLVLLPLVSKCHSETASSLRLTASGNFFFVLWPDELQMSKAVLNDTTGPWSESDWLIVQFSVSDASK